MKNEAVTVRLHFDPTNRCDENAIVVQVKLAQSRSEKLWNPLSLHEVSGNGPIPSEYVEAFDHATSKVHACKNNPVSSIIHAKT